MLLRIFGFLCYVLTLNIVAMLCTELAAECVERIGIGVEGNENLLLTVAFRMHISKRDISKSFESRALNYFGPWSCTIIALLDIPKPDTFYCIRLAAINAIPQLI